MKTVFLILAIIGAIVPYAFFLQFFSSEGVQLTGFISALFANGAAGGFSADLLISSFVFWLAMFYRRGQKGGPSPALFIALNLLIGLSCALPAYFYAITPGTKAAE
jgi:hypothetical protein